MSSTPDTKDQKITCACGSEILAKNISAHNKTKKHQLATGGTIEPKKPKIEITTQVEPCTNSNIPSKKFTFNTRHDEDDDEDDDEQNFEDDVLDRLEHIEDVLANLTKLMNDGFGLLLGEDLKTIKEENQTLKPESGSLKSL